MKPRWFVLPLALTACADAATVPQVPPRLTPTEVSSLSAVLADAEMRLLPAVAEPTLPSRIVAEVRSAVAAGDAGAVATSAAVVAAALPPDSEDPDLAALRLAFDHVRDVATRRLTEARAQ